VGSFSAGYCPVITIPCLTYICRLFYSSCCSIQCSVLFSPSSATLVATEFYCWWSSYRCSSCCHILAMCFSSLYYCSKCTETLLCDWCEYCFVTCDSFPVIISKE